MWNTGFGMGAGMWLLMVAITVAFWLLVAVAVREVLVPSHRARDRHHRHHRHAGDELGTSSAHIERGVGTETRDGLSGRTASPDPLSVVQERLARGDIDVDEYAQIRRALVESHQSLNTDHGATEPPPSSSPSGAGRPGHAA